MVDAWTRIMHRDEEGGGRRMDENHAPGRSQSALLALLFDLGFRGKLLPSISLSSPTSSFLTRLQSYLEGVQAQVRIMWERYNNKYRGAVESCKVISKGDLPSQGATFRRLDRQTGTWSDPSICFLSLTLTSLGSGGLPELPFAAQPAAGEIL